MFIYIYMYSNRRTYFRKENTECAAHLSPPYDLYAYIAYNILHELKMDTLHD